MTAPPVADLSPAEVAAEMGISRSAVYRAIEDGDLVAYKVRSRLRVERAELDAFKARQRVTPRVRQAYEPALPSPRARESDTFAGKLRAIRGGRAA